MLQKQFTSSKVSYLCCHKTSELPLLINRAVCLCQYLDTSKNQRPFGCISRGRAIKQTCLAIHVAAQNVVTTGNTPNVYCRWYHIANMIHTRTHARTHTSVKLDSSLIRQVITVPCNWRKSRKTLVMVVEECNAQLIQSAWPRCYWQPGLACFFPGCQITNSPARST
jgi:hypothetical protein